MLKQHFYIDEYSWEIYAFYCVEPIHRIELYSFLDTLGYLSIVGDISTVAGLLNGGYCYTNYRDKRSIIVVNIAENLEQFCNTIVHELNHVGSHIEEYYRIDSHGEEACYLIGYLAQKVSEFLSFFK